MANIVITLSDDDAQLLITKADGLIEKYGKAAHGYAAAGDHKNAVDAEALSFAWARIKGAVVRGTTEDAVTVLATDGEGSVEVVGLPRVTEGEVECATVPTTLRVARIYLSIPLGQDKVNAEVLAGGTCVNYTLTHIDEYTELLDRLTTDGCDPQVVFSSTIDFPRVANIETIALCKALREV